MDISLFCFFVFRVWIAKFDLAWAYYSDTATGEIL